MNLQKTSIRLEILDAWNIMSAKESSKLKFDTGLNEYNHTWVMTQNVFQWVKMPTATTKATTSQTTTKAATEKSVVRGKNNMLLKHTYTWKSDFQFENQNNSIDLKFIWSCVRHIYQRACLHYALRVHSLDNNQWTK